MTPVECLILAAHATERRTVEHWLNKAVDQGMPLADKRRALDEWDKANPVVRLEVS